jgi:hypothetical protein
MQTRYKQEIEASGLSQKEWYAQIYLKSDHWKTLKKAKAKEVGRKCEICGSKKKLEFHHDNYRDIYDVTTADLRILCHTHHHEFHFGTKPEKASKKKGKKTPIPTFNIDGLDLRSPSLAESVKPLIRGLKNCEKNLRLNDIIMKMRSLKLPQDAINSIIILKSGAKARRLKAAICGGSTGKWNRDEFEYHWSSFLTNRKPSFNLGLIFQSLYEDNLRLRHKRELNRRMLTLELNPPPRNNGVNPASRVSEP